ANRSTTDDCDIYDHGKSLPRRRPKLASLALTTPRGVSNLPHPAGRGEQRAGYRWPKTCENTFIRCFHFAEPLPWSRKYGLFPAPPEESTSARTQQASGDIAQLVR